MDHYRQVASAVHRLTGRWRAAPPISVVTDAAALPFDTSFPIRGALARGEVFIVASGQSEEMAASTAVHELVGHFGFRQMLGQHWNRYMTHVLGAIRAGEPTLRLAADVIAETYTDVRGDCNLAPIQFGDECVARVTEWSFNPSSGAFEIDEPLRKQLLALINHAAREGLHLDIPLTRDELEGAILASAETVRHGAPLRGFGKWLPGWYRARMKPMGPARPAADWDESKRLLEAANHHDGWWGRTKETLGFLLIVGSIAGMIWWVLALFGFAFR